MSLGFPRGEDQISCGPAMLRSSCADLGGVRSGAAARCFAVQVDRARGQPCPANVCKLWAWCSLWNHCCGRTGAFRMCTPVCCCLMSCTHGILNSNVFFQLSASRGAAMQCACMGCNSTNCLRSAVVQGSCSCYGRMHAVATHASLHCGRATRPT